MDFEQLIMPMVKFLIAIVVGGVIGLDREKKGKPAGLKTHAIICLGATIATEIGVLTFKDTLVGDPLRIAAQITSGLGFIGAGVIMTRDGNKITGLTTAATLWLCGCMGICVGSDYYYLALPATIAYFIVSKVMPLLEPGHQDFNAKDDD